MSRLGDKLNRFKDKHTSSQSSKNSVPSFRFHKNDEDNLEEILSTEPEVSDQLTTDTTNTLRHALSSQENDLDDKSFRDASPMKEAILTKFARLAPSSLATTPQASGGVVNPGEAEMTVAGSMDSPSTSWIHQVKGRISRTVEEKMSEYRQEKELRRSVQNVRIPEIDEAEAESEAMSSIPHSMSENVLNVESSRDLDLSEIEKTPTAMSVTPPKGASATNLDPSPKEKRRFTFSFRDKAAKSPPVVKNDDLNSCASTPLTNENASGINSGQGTSSAPQTVSATPTKSSSLRVRMMGLMGKSPSSAQLSTSQKNEPAVSVNMAELRGSPCGEDPFSGVDLGISRLSPSNDELSSSIKFRPNSFPSPLVDPEPDETGMEAHEALTFEHVDNSHDSSANLVSENTSVPNTPTQSLQNRLQSYLQHWWFFGIPGSIILLIQILPLPYWITGFITGILLAIPAAVYATLNLINSIDDSPRTRFVENVSKKERKRSAIIVQEEIKSRHTWMNLWPLKRGPYDPLTYDVRKTSTVRVLLHGPWLELRFPRMNLPFRKTFEDVEPTNVEFHDRVEVFDLSTCSVELQPHNLPSKRIWSKKYPIVIRTRMRKPRSSPETSRKMAQSSSENDLKIVKEGHSDEGDNLSTSVSSDYNDAEMMFDAKEDFSDDDSSSNLRHRKNCDKKTEEETSFVMVPEEEAQKTFFLFTRTSREKEEWFNHFLVAAKFMQDWEYQNPKDSTKIDPNYETQKVREQKFASFMDDYFQARTREEAMAKHEETLSTPQLSQCAREQMAFVNIFAARMWHDLHDSKFFIDFLREKLTRKLLKVKIAQYFNDVRVTTLDLGPQLPKVNSASLPWQDELGLWLNLEVEYSGICQATVETQGIHWPNKDEPDREAQELALSRLAATMDSDEEDSAEEDDECPDTVVDPTMFDDSDPGFEGLQPHASTGLRARMLDTILRSEFLAKVAESEWVKKNITGRAITLQLQLHSVRGTLTLNFPPAPSDRIWYGFRSPPALEIALRPSFGGHPIGKYEGTLSTIMKHLEKRLKQEFMKVLVFPNLDDEVLPFMDRVVYSFNSNTSTLKQSSLSPQ